MIPVLITGGTEAERFEKAKKISNFSRKAGSRSAGQFPISNFDLIFLDSPTTIGIDEIRGLLKKLSLKPFGPGAKVAIINNAQNLTIAAQNAFLKTLEEPPKNSQTILTAPTSESLLPTVISRCQLIKLPQKPQISLTKKELTNHFNLLILILNSSIGERLKKIDKLNLTKDRQKAIEWVDTQTVVVRQALLNRLASSPSPLSTPSKPSKSQLKAPKAVSLSSCLAVQLLKSLLRTKKYLQANVNTRLALDNLLLDLDLQGLTFCA